MGKRRLGWLMISIAIAAFLLLLWLARGASDQMPLAARARANYIVVVKGKHVMELWNGSTLLKTYRVSLGRGGSGPKVRAGDNKVPEGTYPIVGRNAHSAFYRALRVGYPTAVQAQQARAAGFDAGGDIMIHGVRNGLGWVGRLQRLVDWTKGCVAVTDAEMDEIWRAVPDGTPVEIRR